MGMDWVVAHIQPGPRLSEQRKMLRRGIGPQRVGSHDEKIEKHATRLMVSLNNFKGSPRELIQRSVFTF
jgi:cytochrome P450